MAVAAALDPTVRGPESEAFEHLLGQKIVGQEEAVAAVADIFQLYEAGLAAPGHPVGNLLFLGPTGSGKTRVVEAVAEILFGNPRAIIKVDCAEFQHSHEIAKLVGSPPGYLGHRETHPLITQEALARYHTDRVKLSLLLFDEIEKASDALWQLLLGILDKATLTLGDNRRVDLSDTLIFLTSNLGAAEIDGLMESRFGFAPKNPPTRALDAKIEHAAIDAARRKFSPEFLNRIDKVVVFRPLLPEQLERVLDLELDAVQRRLLDSSRARCTFRLDSHARSFLLREGTDLHYGARHLKRAIERHLVGPLANLIASSQVGPTDLVSIAYDEGRDRLVFAREAGKAPQRHAIEPEIAAGFAAANLAGFPLSVPAAVPCAGRERRSMSEPYRARRRER